MNLWKALIPSGGALLLCLVLMPAVTMGAPIEGTWGGTVVFKPAELEVDVLVDIVQEDGKLAGYFSVPAKDLDRKPLQTVEFQDGRLFYIDRDETGDSVFTGQLSAEGDRIIGQLTELGETYPLTFERNRQVLGPEQEVRDLGSLDPIKELFNQSSGSVRLVVVVAPSCGNCRVGVSLLQKYLLARIPDDRLRVFVIWEPVSSQDTPESLKRAARFLHDPRVIQFWSPGRVAGRGFQEALGSRTPVWDVFMVFPPAAEWQEAPPKPDYYMHNRQNLPAVLRLNGVKLEERVRQALGSARATETKPVQ